MHYSLKLFPGAAPRLAIILVTALGLSTGGNSALAATPDTAPPELKNALSQIDAAANRRDVQGVMQLYSPNFSNSDGLNRQNMEKALGQLWQRYPQLQYRTSLESWERDRTGAILAVTVTQITGTQAIDGRDWTFNSTIRSRQRLENQKIARQEILAERTQLTSGEKPPNVEIKLPETVRAGQDFTFDAVVREPLGDDVLVGAALQESITAQGYLNPTQVQLEPLAAGGIFKQGRAPNNAGKYWISAVLVRADGMTIVTQRLQVEGTARPTRQQNRPSNPRTRPTREQNRPSGGAS
ncbi:nuclear transport factor 2 family protein [Microseira sp. BLCC-F43]|uniref:nuclear transport factor 2 family protein n=1 Tax=Microseira sp. BLCC-F43 TaxID=3153602 RepID=UPI0035BAC54A